MTSIEFKKSSQSVCQCASYEYVCWLQAAASIVSVRRFRIHLFPIYHFGSYRSKPKTETATIMPFDRKQYKYKNGQIITEFVCFFYLNKNCIGTNSESERHRGTGLRKQRVINLNSSSISNHSLDNVFKRDVSFRRCQRMKKI